MNIIVIILLVLAIITAIFLIVAAFTKKGYSIRRSVVIDRPAASVFDYLSHIVNQEKFSKWVMTDPEMKKTFRGTDGTAGFVYAWDGNKKAGKGEQEIIKIDPGKRIDIEVRFERPFAATAYTPFSLEEITPVQTKVSWDMRSEMKYPMNFMLLFLDMEKLLGRDMEESLQNLKRILGNEPAA